MKNSEILLKTIGDLRMQAPLLDLSQKRVLLANLIFVYQVIRSTEDLLLMALKKTSALSLYDEYLTTHIWEEKDHEKWLREDLQIGCISSVDKYPPIEQASMLVGMQYYRLKYCTKFSLLGYMTVLECFPMPISVVEQLEAWHGVELIRTLRYHAVHDVDHGADLLAIVDTLDDEQFQAVLDNAIASQNLLNEFAGELKKGV
jgi:hypothetical protein